MGFEDGRKVSHIPLHARFVAVVALSVMAAGCSSHVSGKAQKTTLPGLSPARLAALRASAISAAASMGETHPSDGIVVATTQHAFFRAEPNGPKVNSPDFKVYVVAFAGKLTAYTASRPPGTRPPTGRFAYAVHRADTLAVTDSGLLKEPFDLTPLGPHMRLELERAERQRAISYTEMFIRAGNARPFAHRVSRAARVGRGLWRVELRSPAAGRGVHYSCFTIRLEDFYVHTSAADNVSFRGIEATNRKCPQR
jgi:hypothetical protein